MPPRINVGIIQDSCHRDIRGTPPPPRSGRTHSLCCCQCLPRSEGPHHHYSMQARRHFIRIASGLVAAPFAFWACSSSFGSPRFPSHVHHFPWAVVASAYQEQFRPVQKSKVLRQKQEYLIRRYSPYLKVDISIPAEHYIEAFDRGLDQIDQYASGALILHSHPNSPVLDSAIVPTHE